MARAITVSSVRALLNNEKEGSPFLSGGFAPYVVFELNDVRGQTKAVKNAGKDVEWTESVRLEGASTSSGNLSLAVYNHNTLRSDTLVGHGYLKVSSLRDGVTQSVGLTSEANNDAGEVTFVLSGGAFGSSASQGATGSHATTGSHTSTGTGAGVGATGLAAAGGAGTVGRGTGVASNPGTDQSGYASTTSTTTTSSRDTARDTARTGPVIGTGAHSAQPTRATNTTYTSGSGTGATGGRTGIGADDEVARGASSTRTSTTGATGATGAATGVTGGSKTGIGADDEVHGVTRGVRDLGISDQEPRREHNRIPGPAPRDREETTRTTTAHTGTTGVGHTERNRDVAPTSTATNITSGGAPGVDLANYKFTTTHGSNTGDFVSYDEGLVCERKRFTVVEDRPIEREIIVRVIEHRYFEKTFETITRPKGEREVLSDRNVESLGTTSRVVNVTEASSPCAGHPEVAPVGATATNATSGTGYAGGAHTSATHSGGVAQAAERYTETRGTTGTGPRASQY